MASNQSNNEFDADAFVNELLKDERIVLNRTLDVLMNEGGEQPILENNNSLLEGFNHILDNEDSYETAFFSPNLNQICNDNIIDESLTQFNYISEQSQSDINNSIFLTMDYSNDNNEEVDASFETELDPFHFHNFDNIEVDASPQNEEDPLHFYYFYNIGVDAFPQNEEDPLHFHSNSNNIENNNVHEEADPLAEEEDINSNVINQSSSNNNQESSNYNPWNPNVFDEVQPILISSTFSLSSTSSEYKPKLRGRSA